MARILVTGGRGFIGTNLVRELRSRGHDVWTSDIIHGEDPQHIKADVAAFEQMAAILRDRTFDYVYHLAAEYGRWNGEDHYDNLWRTNTIGTKNILRLQEQYGFRQICFSSAEVYGDWEGIMSEDVMDTVPIKQMNDYACSKWVAELQCINSAIMFGTETVRVRPVNCYGPHEHYSPYRGVIPIFVYRCLVGETFDVYTGHQRIFDYVDDTVTTFANIADNFIPGEVYNIGSKEEWAVGIDELAEVVLAATGASRDLVRIHEGEKFTTHVKRIDFSKSRRDLAHDPKVGLEEGVARYVAWMKKTYDR